MWCVLYMLTSKCASCHNGMHFFNISTCKSVWEWCVLYVLTSKFASRHNGAHFFVIRSTTACNFSSLIWPDGSAPAALASLLFDPRGPQIIQKTQCFVTFLPFRAPGSSFFWNFLFFDLLLLFSFSSPSLLLFSSLLWLFPSLLFICPYCRKFDF